MLTIRDIAKLAGVSPAAVSFVINKKPGVSDSTRRKVNAIIEETGYNPHLSSQKGKAKKSNMFGVIIPRVDDIFYSSLINHLEEYARENDLFLVLGTTNSNPKDEKHVIMRFMEKAIDGIIYVPSDTYDLSNYDYLMSLAKKKKTTVVVINRVVPDKEVLCVGTNFKCGEEILTEYLIKKGLEKICFVGGNEYTPYSHEKYKGYEKAMLKHKLKPTRYISDKTYSFEDGYNCAKEIIQAQLMPQAFIAVNDVMALGIIEALQDSGYKVPQDVSVAGHDGLAIPGAMKNNVTSLKVSINDIAIRAVHCIKSQIKGNFMFTPTLSIGTTTKN